MSIDSNINELLEGGRPALSWNNAPIGTVYQGTIIGAKQTQQTDFATKEPKFYSDGNPIMQLVVALQTDERTNEEDDGERSLYVRGQMLQALRDALRKAGVNLPAVGGTLAVKFTGEEPSGKGNPKKLYKMQYTPPVVTIDDEEPF